MKYKEFFKLLIIIIAVLVAGIIYVKQFNNNASMNLTDAESVKYSITVKEETTEATETSETGTKNSKEPEAGEYVYVQVCGQVNSPGVYRIRHDARVYEAVSMAGGFNNMASQNSVNQAQTICDGQQIYIPAEGEETSPMQDTVQGIPDTPADSNGNRININTADIQELKKLPGIGDARAQAIISYRQSNGNFNTIEDIKNVSGIKDVAFEKIKELICVE